MFTNIVCVMGFVFGIVLCFVVIPYKCFIPLTKHPVIDGIISSLFYGFILAYLAAYLWYIAAIVLILIGLGLMGKAQDPTTKKVIMGVFIVLAIVISIIGINTRRENSTSQKNQEESYGDNKIDGNDDYIYEIEAENTDRVLIS